MVILGWAYWAIYQLASVALGLIGLTPIAVLAGLGLWYERASKSKFFFGTVTAWRFEPLTLVWGNEEDGVTGAEWYRTENAGRSARVNAFIWSALRNFSNNMRLLPGATFMIFKHQLVVKRYSWGYTARIGWRMYVCTSKFHFGWLIKDNAEDGWLAWPVIGLT